MRKLTSSEKKSMQALERRAAHLKARIDKRMSEGLPSPTYDLQEAAAIKRVLEIVRKEVGQ